MPEAFLGAETRVWAERGLSRRADGEIFWVASFQQID
jgi:hypothetical protein